MNKTYFFQADIKSFEEDGEAVIIEGYASTPDVDRYKDIVDPKAFKDALDLFMKNPVMLRSHDPDRPVGTWLSATVSGRGLKVRGKVVDPQTKQEILDGRMRALSIGYIPEESELQHADGTPFNFEKDDIFSSDLVRKITKLDLIEISIVSTPANGYALFTLAKSAKLYFNELVTKSFMKTKNNVEEPGKDVQPEEGATEETKTPEETPEGEAPKAESEEEKSVSEDDEEEEEEAGDDEEKATEVSKKEAGTPEGDEAPQSTEQGSENAGETPAADTEEAPKGDDESATDDESEEEEEGSDDESEKAISVDEETAKTLDEFVQAGVMAVAKDAKNVLVIPKQIQNLLLAMKTVIGDQKEVIEGLNSKLNKTPAKRALKVTGQFNEEKELGGEEEEEGETKKTPTAFSKAFKSLIQNAK